MLSAANKNSTLFTQVCYPIYWPVGNVLVFFLKWESKRVIWLQRTGSHHLSSSQVLLQPGLLLYISHADAVTWISTFSSCLCSQIFKIQCSRLSLFFFSLKSLNAALAYWSLSYWTLTVCSKFYGGIFISACTVTLILSKDCYQWLYHYCVTPIWFSNYNTAGVPQPIISKNVESFLITKHTLSCTGYKCGHSRAIKNRFQLWFAIHMKWWCK